nr:MAG TPA: hypothetical protein [Siphoviridae sp. ctBfm1]DAR77128.1 MAG TPA: hypothetical protein [Caudoviricetes sp.]
MVSPDVDGTGDGQCLRLLAVFLGSSQAKRHSRVELLYLCIKRRSTVFHAASLSDKTTIIKEYKNC